MATYGPAPSGSKVKAWDPSRKLWLNSWGAPNLNDDQNYEQRAQDAAQVEYGGKQRALEEAQRQATAQYNRLVDEERTYGQEVDPRVENIYDALQRSLGTNLVENKATYGNAIDQIRDWYDQAHGANQQLNTEAMDRITSDAERLGLEEALPAGTQRMTEDFLYNQTANRNAQAGRSANMLELAAKIEALDRNRVGAAGREGGQQRAMLANEIAQTIGDLGLDHYNELSQLRGEIGGLMGDRAAYERNAMDQYKQQDFENLQTSRGNALQEFLSRAGLGLQQAEFNRGNWEADRNFDLALQELGLSREQLGLERERTSAEIEQQKSNDAIRWAELEFERSKWQKEFDEATSPEARARAKAELDRILAETNALRGETTAAKYPAGEFGYNQYIKDNNIREIDRKNSRKIIELARTRTDPNFAFKLLDLATRDPSRVVDEYNIPINPSAVPTLRNLVTVYFTGLGGS